MRYKGIILELDDSGALLINNEGEYLRIRRTEEMEIGVCVDFSKTDILKDSKGKVSGFPKIYLKYIYVFGSVAAAVIIMVSAFLLMSRDMSNSTFAYIDIDINPSIDLKVNQEGYIIGVEPLNKDAEKIAQNIDYMGQKAEDAVLATVKKSAELGYLQNENKLVLVAAAINVKDKISADQYMKLNSKLGDLIDSIENRVNAENKDINLIAFNTSPGKMKQARENHMSIGRYSLYKNAGEDGIELALDDAKSLKISELINLLPSKDYTDFKEEEKKSAMEDTQFIESAPDSLPKKNNYVVEEPTDSKKPVGLGNNTPAVTQAQNDNSKPGRTIYNTPLPEKDESGDNDKKTNDDKNSNSDIKPSHAADKTISDPVITPAASPSTEPAVHHNHGNDNNGKGNDVRPTVQNAVVATPTTARSTETEKKTEVTPPAQQSSTSKPDVTPPAQQSSTSKPVVTPPGQEKKNSGSDVVPPGQEKNNGSDVIPPGQQKKQSDSVVVPSESPTTDSSNSNGNGNGNGKGKGKKKTE